MENQIISSEPLNTAISVKSEENPFILKSVDKTLEVMNELNKLSLVTPHEVNIMERAQAFVLSTYTDVPAHRTFMDKCVGVLTNARFPTPDAKYWQCKKEAEVQFYELMREMLNYKKTNINLREILYKKEKAKEILARAVSDSNNDPFLIQCDIERMDLAILEINISVKKIEKEIKFRIAEIGDWLSIANEWEGQMKHSKDIYSQHQTEALYMFIESQMREAKAAGDDNAYNNFADQLQTLQSLLKRKLEAVMKGAKNQP